MVKLNVKKGDDNQFLVETTLDQTVDECLKIIANIYNGRLKIQRLCSEIDFLSKSGITLPYNMQGLTDEQIEELKLVDEWSEKCTPSGGYVERKDELGRRNGKAPTEKMAEVLQRTIKEAKEKISKELVKRDVCLTQAKIQEAIDELRGAVTICYPMGLPPHDPIRMEFENKEDLEGTQAALDVIPVEQATLWFGGKEMQSGNGKKLSDYLGKNEKTKVIVKIQKGKHAPAREPVVSEEEQKKMMAFYYKKQEEMKKLAENEDDSYLDSNWADNQALRRQFQGLNNIKWKP